jgi:L-lactate dehydrogenase complex protein LldG
VVTRAHLDPSTVSDPHALAGVDFCVAAADLAVAENGAMWITGHGGIGRAVLFLTQHLAVIVNAADVVNDLHEAYARITLPQPGFGVFLSGPSKTADIEQSLVIGAHGARSCTVLLVG